MYVVFCELPNLSCQFKNERYLGGGLSIKRMSDYICSFVDEYRGFSSPGPRWMIWGAPRRESRDREGRAIANDLPVLVDALLLHCGPRLQVGAQCLCKRQGRRKLEKRLTAYSALFRKDAIGGSETISLTSRQIPELKKLFVQLKARYESPFIKIPLTFYREACVSLAVPWKQIVYLCMALESLFLDQERNKAHELATRVASFVGGQQPIPERTYRHVFDCYKARNAIMHEGEVQSLVCLKYSDNNVHVVDCRQLADVTFDLFRQSVARILRTEQPDRKAHIENVKRLASCYQFRRPDKFLAE